MWLIALLRRTEQTAAPSTPPPAESDETSVDVIYESAVRRLDVQVRQRDVINTKTQALLVLTGAVFTITVGLLTSNQVPKTPTGLALWAEAGLCYLVALALGVRVYRFSDYDGPPSLAAVYHTALAQLRDQTSNFVAELLDLLTEYAAGRQDRLTRVVGLRTEAANILGLTEDALADLEHTINALEPAADA